MADSPLMYLRLGESSGPTAFDETGRHDASEDGVLTWGVRGPLVLDGDTAIESVGAGGLIVNETGWLPTGSAQRTLELWFKPNLNTLTNRGISYGDSAGGGLLAFTYTASALHVSAGNCVLGIQNLTLSEKWYHVALVFPHGGTRCDEFLLYLNGQNLPISVLAGQGSALVDTSDSVLWINQTPAGEYNYCGLSEVAIYGTALPASRIAKHYQVATTTGAI